MEVGADRHKFTMMLPLLISTQVVDFTGDLISFPLPGR